MLHLVTCNEQTILDEPWIGQRFKHGHEPFGHGMGFIKSIRPTRIIFHGGLHMAGACKLPAEWNGCNNGEEYCVTGEGPFSRLTKLEGGGHLDFHLNHYFDEVVMFYDAKKVNASSEGVLNHLQYRRQYRTASKTALALQGEYATTHFSPVYEALERRGLIMPVELPERDGEPVALTMNWLYYDEVYSTGESDILAANNGAVKNGKNDVHFDDFTSITPPPRISLCDLIQNHTSQSIRDNDTMSNISLPDDSGLSILPAFSQDKSDLFLASMIEREADSWNLHVTTFLLCHKILRSEPLHSESRRIRDDKETLTTWAQAIVAFNDTKYEDGIRVTPPRYLCKITASSSRTAYSVPGKNDRGYLEFVVWSDGVQRE